MVNMIKNLFRWARVTKAGPDNKQFPVQQVEYLGKVADCMMLFPYGVHGNLTPDSLILMMSVQGQEENRVGIGGTPNNRPELAPGEVAYYHPPTGTIIHMRASGDIDINTGSGNVNVNTTNANVTASDSVKIDTPETIITGNVQIDGSLNVDGDITGLSDIIATALLQGATLTISGNGSIGGKDFITHTHAQGNDSDGDSQVNTGGVV